MSLNANDFSLWVIGFRSVQTIYSAMSNVAAHFLDVKSISLHEKKSVW